MTGYSPRPTLQGRNKWRVTQKNLTPGQLVLLSDAEDVFLRGAYRMGRIHCVHLQVRKGKELVRDATVAVLSKNSTAGFCDIDHVQRNLSKIAPV